MVEEVRKSCSVPLALMTYYNPVFVFGLQRFFERCKRAGISAVIIPDLPFEEQGEILPVCRKYGVAPISMIAPTSRQRIQEIAKNAQGFLYCVSSLGVTGMRQQFSENLEEMIKTARRFSNVPLAIGFGVSTAGQAKEMAKLADGVIVGSAVVKIVEQYGAESIPYVVPFVKEMKQAMMECLP